MQDRPTFDELLAAVEHFLDSEIVPNVAGARGFHARVATNAIRIVRRELQAEDGQFAAEWAGLDAILGPAEPPRERDELRMALRDRNEQLCALIRSGDMSEETASRIFQHVRAVVEAKIAVSDPELLQRSQNPLNRPRP